MKQSQDLLEKMALPYFAHCQARIAPPLHSIAWNKIALSGYIDIAILFKDLDPPGSFLRKIRAFYENYEHIANSNPILGELDALLRNLSHLDKSNNKAVISFALRWNNTIQALEKLCLELVSQQKIGDHEQIIETLQSFVFNIQEETILPKWNQLLDQQQLELTKMIQLKNIPAPTLPKVNFKHHLSGNCYTEQRWLNNLIHDDKEIQDIINMLNKNFLRLINLINDKIPEPERQIKPNLSNQVSTTQSQDYRLSLTYFYDGNDEGEYHTNFFSHLRNFLK